MWLRQAKAGSAACCKLLIQGAADSNFKDSYLRTPVHIAAQLGAVVRFFFSELVLLRDSPSLPPSLPLSLARSLSLSLSRSRMG